MPGHDHPPAGAARGDGAGAGRRGELVYSAVLAAAGGQVGRAVSLAAVAVAVALASGCAPGPAARQARPAISYYLSLGDSLSQGVQPDSAGSSVETRQGYADLLHAQLRRGAPRPRGPYPGSPARRG